MSHPYQLPPPQLAPGLARGNDKGGIFDASWLPTDYINATYPTVPADSPNAAEVPQRISTRRLSFATQVMTPTKLTNGSMGAYVAGPRRSLPIPGFNPMIDQTPGNGIFG